MRIPTAFSLLALAAGAPLSAQEPARAADLVVTNARIYTADAARPRARALAVRDGRLIYVGNDRGAEALAGPETRRLDLAGRTVIPGMIDAHAHLLGLGQLLSTVDLTGTRSYDEVVARVAERARRVPAGTWIRGRGWDQNDWADTGFPTHDALSRAVPDHPVYLSRVDGHAALVNARAMRVAELASVRRDPAGGRVLRDAAGRPTGVLVDAAMPLVAAKIPAPTDAELREATLAAIAEANRWGLTGIHDAGVSRRGIAVYAALAAEGRFDLRNYVMLDGSDSATMAEYLAKGPAEGLHGGRLWIRAIKLYGDGALGSRGAALLEPYSDDPDNTGLLQTSEDELTAQAERALRHGFQLNVHAIGDRANRMVLNAFERAFRAVPTADHRFRIEHAQILAHQDLRRFAELGVIPSMQGSHQTSDMYWAVQRIGPARVRGAYAWRSLLETGVVIPNGSDFPVEHPNPLISFHAFATRQDADDFPAGGWYPEQRTTREEALLAMTLWPAMAGFMENAVGSLTPGKYADFTVLDRDIMTVAPEDILATRVEMTVVGGKTVYEGK